MKRKVSWFKRLLAVGLSLAMLTGMQWTALPGMENTFVNVVHASEEVTVSGNDQIVDKPTNDITVSGNDQNIVKPIVEPTVSGNEQPVEKITDEPTVSGNDIGGDKLTEELTVSGNDLGPKARNVGAGTYFAQNDPDGAVEAAVRNGTILQVFCWSFNTMIENMDDIAAAGYTAIQTSPINECIATNPALTLSGNGMWYYHYQPTDWVIGNYQLGTRDEFIAMCAEADKYGIKVIVDILPNHTTATRSEVKQTLINAAGAGLDELYHETGLTNMSNYGDRFECTYYAMGGLPDVDTENVGFQDYFFAYLQDCIDCGADGFRIDTAKHIALPDDPTPEGSDVENNFYPNMYYEVTSQNDIFVYGEVLQGANERLGAYQDAIGGTTASSYGGAIRSALVNNDYSVSKITGYEIADDATPSKLVTWVESHDNYINDGTWNLLDEEQVKLGWAIITARKEGTPLFFSRPMGSSKENMWGENKIGIAGSDIYKDDEVVAVNKFRTAMQGESENLRNPNNNSQIIMIERGTKGVTIVNGSYSAYSLDSVTNLEEGTYVNMTDDNSVFTVTNGVINGVLPARSVVVLSEKSTTAMTTVFFYNSEMWNNVSAIVNDAAEAISATSDGDGWWRVAVEAAAADGFAIKFTNGSETTDAFTVNATTGRYMTGSDERIFTSKSEAEDALGIVKTSVYLLNSAVWDSVSAYAWIGENQILGGWPGAAAVYEGDYWWRIDIPAEPSDELFVIFNNADGSQTENIAIANGTDVYVTNTTADKYTSKEVAEQAAGVSSNLTTVYYYNSKAWENVYTYTWGNSEALGGWPGEAAEDIGNGWWKKVIPTGASSELNVIFNNGKVDGESDKQQAAGVVVSNIRDIYLTYTGEKFASIAEAEESLGLSSTETKVYYYDTDNWDEVYAYAKNSSSNEEYLGAWPGTKMTEDYNGWEFVTIPTGASDNLKVTFSNGNTDNGNEFVVNDRTKVYLTGDDSTAYANKIAAETALGVPLSATTVYFYNCDEWEEVAAYVYGGNLGEIFGGWPGTVATDEGDGWWKVQVPGLVSDNFTIIFNNNNNNKQTADIPMTDQSKVYTTVGTANTYSSKEAVEAYIADLRSTIDVYYYDTDNWDTTYVYAKSKSTGKIYLDKVAMTEDSNGWQVISIPAAASDDLEVTFSNGAKEAGKTFTVNDRTKLYLTGQDFTAYAGKIEAEKALGVELSATTVYFYNSSNWSTVNVWAWDSANNYTGGVWPGVAATKEGDSDWWKFAIPATVSSELKVIFSNGAGAQTANLDVNDANKLYYAVNNQAYSSKEEAEAVINAIPEETDVYFYNSDNWPVVCAHYWSGTTQFTQWPGIQATDEGNGWWKVTLNARPASDLTVIFNNNNNGVQTGDYVISDASKVYAIKETTTLFTSKEQAETMRTALQGSMDVYFYNDSNWDSVNGYAWIDDVKLLGEWPGVAATDEGDGWWKVTVPASAGSSLKLIFNGSGGQTTDLTLADASKLYLLNRTFYASKEEAEAALDAIPVETDVYFYNSDNWPAVSAHYWNGTGAFTSWPGVAATNEGNGWWKVTLNARPASDLTVIFNNNNNGLQTGDYVISDASKVYATKATTVLFTSKEQAEQVYNALQGSTDVYFYNNGNWDSVNGYAWIDDVKLLGEWPGVAATDEGDGWWKVTVPASAGSSLKIIFNGSDGQTSDLSLADSGKVYVLSETFYASKAAAEAMLSGNNNTGNNSGSTDTGNTNTGNTGNSNTSNNNTSNSTTEKVDEKTPVVEETINVEEAVDIEETLEVEDVVDIKDADVAMADGDDTDVEVVSDTEVEMDTTTAANAEEEIVTGNVLIEGEEKESIQVSYPKKLEKELEGAKLEFNEITVSEEEQKIVEEIIGDKQIGQYFDISLFKENGEYISNLSGEIIITIDVPGELRGNNYKFSVVRVHDNVATELEDLDEIADTVTFKTSQFSTYALAYEDAEIVDVPVTGNNTTVAIIVMIVFLAGLGVLLLWLKSKKNNKVSPF